LPEAWREEKPEIRREVKEYDFRHRHSVTNAWGKVRMLLQRKHTIMRWKDLSVQLAGMALFITVVRNEVKPAQGCF
jgi:hypothetical protein